MKNFVLSVLAFMLINQCTVYGQLASDTAAKISALFASYGNDEPGGVLEIRRGGQPLYRKVFGVTNLEQPSPIHGSTAFVAASVTKQFTAAGVLLLVKDKKLSLEDDIRSYIPELPDFGKTITIRQLLTHTSGMRDWWNVTYLTGTPSGKRVFGQKFALQFISQQKSLNYEPGERYSYTNAGYDLASVLIERLTKESFREFIKKRLLDPAGMAQSQIRSRFDMVIPNMATGYQRVGGEYRKGYVLDETYGAAGLITTAADLAKWNEFIYATPALAPLRALREERYVLNNGDTITYAAGGVHVRKVNGVKEVSHTGLEGGFRSLCAYYPEFHLSVTYMSNNRSIATVDIQKSLAEIFFGVDKADVNLVRSLPKPTKKGRRLASASASKKEAYSKSSGIYLNIHDESDLLNIFEKNNQLLNHAAPLTEIADDVYQYETAVYQFLPDQNKAYKYQQGEVYTYRKLTRFQPADDQLEQFAGTFYSQDAGVTLRVTQSKGRLFATLPEGDVLPLTPLFVEGDSYAFRTFPNGLRAVFFFEKGEEGSISGIRVTLPRAANIPFTKVKN